MLGLRPHASIAVFAGRQAWTRFGQEARYAIDWPPKAPKLHISPLEIARLPALQFHGRIIVIGSVEEEKRVESIFADEALLGFDSESRPSSALGPQNRIALIQLASEKVACLWRVGGARSLPPLLRKLLQDPMLHKVSQGAVNEINVLKDQFGISPQSFIDLHHIALHLKTTPRSLQGLAAIFLQKRLNKDQRLTDWQQSSLTQAQIEYAALDAWTSREVLAEMRRVFMCPRLECERLLGAAALSRPVAGTIGSPVARSPFVAVQDAKSEREASKDEVEPAQPPPPPEAHRELAALCVSSGYILRFDGFESLPSGFRCVFRVEFRQNGQAVSKVFRSKRVHGSIRAAQNDAAAEALSELQNDSYAEL